MAFQSSVLGLHTKPGQLQPVELNANSLEMHYDCFEPFKQPPESYHIIRNTKELLNASRLAPNNLAREATESSGEGGEARGGGGVILVRAQ